MRRLLAIGVLAVMMGCEKNPEKCSDLNTVRHDGHTWVICNGGHGTSGVTHHPDCQCMKKDDNGKK